MRAILVHAARADSSDLLNAVRAVTGIDSVVPVVHGLHAVAVIRTLRPDVILLHAEACTEDHGGLLRWLRARSEAGCTVLVRLEADLKPPARLAHIAGVPLVVLPRDQARLADLLYADAQTPNG
jgi:hypothetical protein